MVAHVTNTVTIIPEKIIKPLFPKNCSHEFSPEVRFVSLSSSFSGAKESSLMFGKKNLKENSFSQLGERAKDKGRNVINKSTGVGKKAE